MRKGKENICIGLIGRKRDYQTTKGEKKGKSLRKQAENVHRSRSMEKNGSFGEEACPTKPGKPGNEGGGGMKIIQKGGQEG